MKGKIVRFTVLLFVIISGFIFEVGCESGFQQIIIEMEPVKRGWFESGILHLATTEYDIQVNIEPVYFESEHSWPLEIKIYPERGGAWVSAEIIKDHGRTTHRNVTLFVRTYEQRQKWIDCIREYAMKNYAPCDVVPCQ